MAEHYTRSTNWVMARCSKCKRDTAHRVDDRRKGPCLTCIDKREAEHQAAKRKPVQSSIDWMPPAA
jgi:hypothetical protein